MMETDLFKQIILFTLSIYANILSHYICMWLDKKIK